LPPPVFRPADLSPILPRGLTAAPIRRELRFATRLKANSAQRAGGDHEIVAGGGVGPGDPGRRRRGGRRDLKFTTPGFFVFTAPVTGEYLIAISGASGGSNIAANLPGGLGASISGVVKLFAGDSLGLNVGAEGQYTGGESGRTGGAGGGGSSLVVGSVVVGDDVGEAIAGGGGGAGFMGAGSPGLTGLSGGAGGGANGGAAGTVGDGGGGGSFALGSNGGGGAGVPSGDVTGNGAMAAGVIPGPEGYFRMVAPGALRAARAATTAEAAAATAAEAAGWFFWWRRGQRRRRRRRGRGFLSK
jgi:hypothetical protein